MDIFQEFHELILLIKNTELANIRYMYLPYIHFNTKTLRALTVTCIIWQSFDNPMRAKFSCVKLRSIQWKFYDFRSLSSSSTSNYLSREDRTFNYNWTGPILPSSTSLYSFNIPNVKHGRVELLFEMKLIMFKVTKGMMIGNHCLQQVTRVTQVTCKKIMEKFTISALSCINCFACSPQIAGTVNTQRISSSEQGAFDLSRWRKSLSLKYLMDKENTVTAKHSLPLSSWMIFFLLRCYKTGKDIATCSHYEFSE